MSEPLVKVRHCRHCGADFPPTADRRLRYCNEGCRKKYARALRAASKAGIDASVHTRKDLSQAVTPYVQAARALAFEGMEDEIRDTLRVEVRDQVRQHLKDNILGGVEALTALLPQVLLRLGEDVEHPDWMRSSRAQSLILKYVMMFKDTDAQEGDSHTVNIFHGVPIPATPLGDRMKAIVEEQDDSLEVVTVPATAVNPEAGEDEVVELPREEFEELYPECIDCGDVKPPETFATLDESALRGRCRSCDYQHAVKANFKKGQGALPEAPDSVLERDQ